MRVQVPLAAPKRVEQRRKMQIINSTINWFKDIPWSSFWSKNTAFSTFPPVKWEYMWFYIGFAILCYVLLVILLFIKKMDLELKARINSFLTTNVWLCILFGFFRYQRIPLLGMDFVRTIQLIANIFWIISIIRFKKVFLPQIKLQQKIEDRKSKYLPKSKKK